MPPSFFEKPILNTPYEYPARHWQLDEEGQPTNEVIETRRPASYVTPVPKPKKKVKKSAEQQRELEIDEDEQLYKTIQVVNELRDYVDLWRKEPDPAQWRVTPETQRLLTHWRTFDFQSRKPFFCQIEAVETLIWLTEVAPQLGKRGKQFLGYLEDANQGANPGLARIALKMATGSGKTTVMAMIIAWQTVNAVRQPNSKRFTRGFLVVTPGITIRDRLRVLQPNDPENYYQSFQLVPQDLVPDLGSAKIVITNYHAFKLRERMQLARGSRALLEGRDEERVETLETDGQMLQRVMPGLMGMKRILVLNDEAHHCYREKPAESEEEIDRLKYDAKKEAKNNLEAARLWITGLETVERKLGLQHVVDLSATPFFLSGSGYREGTLFPWTMSDFSLMDAIECGIVKLPRVPVSDDVVSRAELPMLRNLWVHIRKDMPKKRRGEVQIDPEKLPTKLVNALMALYGHYEQIFEQWRNADMEREPCFIVVCNNTATSKLLYDYIAGHHYEQPDGSALWRPPRLELFANYDQHGNPAPKRRTLLIDSAELESGGGLSPSFRKTYKDEIEKFRREIVQRTGDRSAADNLSDEDLLREMMNTVGEPGRLGGNIRCVVSVAMLTEGWDTQTVTHILGVRAFSTQLLCEQVVGRALRRVSYEPGDDGLFEPEYADVLGVPFDFTAEPVMVEPKPPRKTVHVHAVRPERDPLEIRFPRVQGYRTEPEPDRLTVEFTDDSTLVLTSELVGATKTQNRGIIGEATDLTVEHLKEMRFSAVVNHLTSHLLFHRYVDDAGNPLTYLYPQLKRIVRQWLENHLVCKGTTNRSMVIYREIADLAGERIGAAIDRSAVGSRPVQALLDPYNPVGSTIHVNFHSSKPLLWRTDPDKSHVNWVVCDGNWEEKFCGVVESHPRVRAYVKNHGLGFEVPYRFGGNAHQYRPDFIVQVDDGPTPGERGDDDPLNLVVEIKGLRGEDAKVKKETMEVYWVPGVNRLGDYGRWAFAELTDVYELEQDFEKKLEERLDSVIAYRAATDAPLSEVAERGGEETDHG